MCILSEDRFYGGRLVVCQHRNGYRFSIDAALLAAFVEMRPGARVVDLGCGCGIIALLLAYRFPASRVVGVEVQPALAALARDNAVRNGMGERMTVLEKDLRRVQRRHCGGEVDSVVANPPFRPAGSGRVNPDAERACARHEILGTMTDFAAAGRRLLNPGGRFAAVYPALRCADLVCTLRQAGLEPKRMRWVHSYSGSGARLVMVQAVKGAGSALAVDPPLVVYQSPGKYTPEAARILAGV